MLEKRYVVFGEVNGIFGEVIGIFGEVNRFFGEMNGICGEVNRIFGEVNGSTSRKQNEAQSARAESTHKGVN